MNFTKRAGNDGMSRPDDGIGRLGRRADDARNGGRSGQPRDEFVEAFSRQLAARFSTTPPTAAPPTAAPFVPPAVEDPPAGAEVAASRPAADFRMPDLKAPDLRTPEIEVPEIKVPDLKGPAPGRDAERKVDQNGERKEAPARRQPRPALLVHSFFLGAALATAFCLYFFDRTDGPPPTPSAAVANAPPPPLPSDAVAAAPPPPAVPVDRPVVAASPPAEAPPIRREPPAPAATVPDDAPSTINIERETTGGGRALNAADIREIQTRLQSLGLKPGPVDGVAGPQTTAAIQGYLRSRGQAMPARADRALLERLRQETRGR
jgi:hypothetical protein